MGSLRGSSSAVEHLLAKEGVASSNLVFRSIEPSGARLRFKIRVSARGEEFGRAPFC